MDSRIKESRYFWFYALLFSITFILCNYCFVPVSACPTIKFTGTPVSGPVPLSVQFNVTNTVTVDSWNWSFGDGTPWFNTTHLSLRNASHTYAVPGTYTVSLRIFDAGGSNTQTESNYIRATVAAPVAGFTVSPHSGIAPLAIQFNDTSTGTPTAWNWSFRNVTGNNTQVWWSTLQNATRTFGAGNFSIIVNASNSGGFNISTQVTFINVTAAVEAPVAGFTISPHSGIAPLAIQFNDTSTGNPTFWNWSFRNVTGNNTQVWWSTIQNATRTFGAGNFSIIVNASNSGGFNISTQVTFINVTAAAGGSSQSSVPLQVDPPPFTQPSGQSSSGESDSDSPSDPASKGSPYLLAPPVEPAVSTGTVTIGGNSAFEKATVTGRSISDMVITAQQISSPPSSVPALDSPVYQYIEVTPARYSSVQSASIMFEVPESWIADQQSRPESVLLNRYSGGVWTSLPTHLEGVANGHAEYTAESPGFSIFAIITVKGSAIGAGARIAEQSPAQPDETSLPAGPAHNVSPVSAVIPANPTLKAPEQGPAPAIRTDSMVNLIPVIGAIVMIGIAAFLLARRHIPQRERKDKKL